MKAYPVDYLDDVVETQGKLFDLISQTYPDKDTKGFIQAYMSSKTRKSIDEAQAYVSTMTATDLLAYYLDTEQYVFQPGVAMEGFLPDWIGEFYAYYQWYYDIPSAELVKRISVDDLMRSYHGLHDLDLSLAVQKVAAV